jgi:hypothetical protein
MLTKTLIMARDKDTRENFVAWYKDEFGFTTNAATALYDVQMLKTCATLSELDEEAVANICKAISNDTGQSVAELAATKLKLLCYWIKHQYRTSQEIGTTSKLLVRVTLKKIKTTNNNEDEDDNNDNVVPIFALFYWLIYCLADCYGLVFFWRENMGVVTS